MRPSEGTVINWVQPWASTCKGIKGGVEAQGKSHPDAAVRDWIAAKILATVYRTSRVEWTRIIRLKR